jgi:hypothetical protein
LVAAIVSLPVSGFAQDRQNIPSGASLPANCTVGDIFMKTGTTPGLYSRLTTDTWTISGSGGSPAGSNGNVQTNNNGSFGAYAGSSAAANQVVTGFDASGNVTSTSLTISFLPGSIPASKLVGTDIATVGTITTGVWNGTAIGVTKGGTGLASGTSGGVLTFTGSGTLASSAALTANLPVIGGGAGAVVSVGSVSGNTTKFVTESGSVTSGNCFKADASGNAVDFGAGCGGTASPGGADTNVQFNDLTSFGGSSGFLYNKTTHDATLTGLIKSAGQNCTYVTKTTTYTVGATDCIVEALTNAFTINLPTAVGIQGRLYTFKNLQTANALTIDANGSETIDGALTASVINGAITIQSDNANWRIVGSGSAPFTDPGADAVLYWHNSVKSPAAVTLGASLSLSSGTLDVAANGISLAKMATQADKTILSNVSGGTAVPVANTSIPLNTPLVFLAGVCQNATASIGVSTPTSNAATALCKTGSNTQFGVAQYTATGQSIQGLVPILETLTSTTVTVSIQYFQETTQTGAPTFTFSWARVGAAGTLNPAFSDCDSTGTTAATANQLHVNAWTCTVTSLAKGDVFFWKFSYKTAPSGGASNQDLITLTVMPVASKPIGGGL